MSGRDKLMLAAGSLILVAGGPGVMALLTVWGGQVTFLPELTFTYGFSVFACAFGLFFAAWSVYEMLTKGEGGPAVLGPVKFMQETRHLVTTGPYALCRNPMHLGIILYFLGFACYLNSLWALAVPLAMTVFAYAEMAGLLQGPVCPVVLPSRSDSGLSKYYSMAMACLTSNDLDE